MHRLLRRRGQTAAVKQARDFRHGIVKFITDCPGKATPFLISTHSARKNPGILCCRARFFRPRCRQDVSWQTQLSTCLDPRGNALSPEVRHGQETPPACEATIRDSSTEISSMDPRTRPNSCSPGPGAGGCQIWSSLPSGVQGWQRAEANTLNLIRSKSHLKKVLRLLVRCLQGRLGQTAPRVPPPATRGTERKQESNRKLVPERFPSKET